MKVYAIFSVANNYDQPENNLEILFQKKPNFENLRNFFFDSKSVDELKDADILFLADLMRGKTIRYSGYDYRVEEVDVMDN